MKVFELVKYIQSVLTCENADFEAKQLVMYAIDCDNTGFMKIRQNLASEKDIKKCEELAKKRNSGMPLYYILGKAEFYSNEFFVGEGVLVPRDDTEILVEKALERLKNIKAPKVLDLCSGSGAIAISIAKERPDASVDAVELYDEAYEYLQKNIKHNNVKNVTAIKGDALKFVGVYDLVVSNPPYIAEDEKESLSSEVLCEPKTALFAEENGLLFYRKIAENFKKNNNFTLMFEIGYLQAKSVSIYLAENGYENIQTVKDYNDLDRVIVSNK